MLELGWPLSEKAQAEIDDKKRKPSKEIRVEAMRDAVEFFDPTRYTSAASLQDNILFGKIVSGHADASQRIPLLLRQVLDELGLRPLVVTIGPGTSAGASAGSSRLRICT